jgi:hypothetical protein
MLKWHFASSFSSSNISEIDDCFPQTQLRGTKTGLICICSTSVSYFERTLTEKNKNSKMKAFQPVG